MVSRADAWGPFAVLAGLAVLIAYLLARHAVDNHSISIDEANAMAFGRSIANDWSLMWTESSAVARGPERLTSVIFALVVKATDGPAHQVAVFHALSAVFQGLVVVPAYAAGRELGLTRWQAVAAAAVAATGAMAIYGVVVLDVSFGLLPATAMLWAMIRALRRPGIASDLLVLATTVLTALTRIGWAPLVAALLPAVVAMLWFAKPSTMLTRRWLAQLPMALLRRHKLLAGVVAVGALWALTHDANYLLGGDLYGGVRLHPTITRDGLWLNTKLLTAHLALGVAIVVFVIALAVLVRDLVRPKEPLLGGFAWLCAAMFVLFSFAYYASMNEDRYFVVLVPPLVLLGAVGVFRRPPRVWAVVLSGLVTARLVVTSAGWPTQNPFDFFLAPTSLFHARIVVGKLADRLPFGSSHAATLVALAAVAGAVVLVVVAARTRRRRALLAAAGVVFAGVLAYQFAAMDYAARKFVALAGSPDLQDRDLSFIETAAQGGSAAPMATDGVVPPDLQAQLLFLRTYNPQLGSEYFVLRSPDQTAPPNRPTARVDLETGSIRTIGDAPSLLLSLAGIQGVGFFGEFLPVPAPYAYARLERLRIPLRTAWVMQGDVISGYPRGGNLLTLRVFPDPQAPGPTCLSANVITNPAAGAPSRYRIRGADRPLRGVVAPGAPVPVQLRFDRPRALVLTGTPVTLPDGTAIGPSFSDVTVAAC